MNDQTKQLAHESLDKLIRHLELTGRNQDIFDICIQTLNVQKVENPEEMLSTFRAEITVDEHGTASVESLERHTQFFKEGKLKGENTYDIETGERVG